MMQSVEASLKRLETDYIDLYWVHIWDQITPVEEVMRGLDDLVRQGKVLYVGISDAPAWPGGSPRRTHWISFVAGLHSWVCKLNTTCWSGLLRTRTDSDGQGS
jgi:aryl-alcohol dehydrogenase-like predicted oxidoreductase